MFVLQAAGRFWRRQSDAARLCLATALCAFVVDGGSLIANFFTSNALKPGGLSVVGMFYLLLALAGLTWRAAGANRPLSLHWQYPEIPAPLGTARAVSRLGEDA